MRAISETNSHLTHQIVNVCEKGYHFINTRFLLLNRKVEKLAYSYLSPKTADIALKILKALPFATILYCTHPVGPYLTFGILSGVNIFTNKLVNNEPYYHYLNGHGMYACALGITHTVQAFTLGAPGKYLPLIAADIAVAALTFFFAAKTNY